MSIRIGPHKYIHNYPLDEFLTPQQVTLLESLNTSPRSLEEFAAELSAVGTGKFMEAFGVDDFTGVSANTLNRFLQKGFQTELALWKNVVSTRSLKDFREVTAISVGSFGTFPEVPPGKDLPSQKFSTSDVPKYSPKKYGFELPLTFEEMTNDDLGVFTARAQAFGASAQLTLNKFIFATILDDHAKTYTLPGDSSATGLFDNTHNNTLGATTPLSLANLKTAISMLEDQTDIDGNPITMKPAWLVVHPDDRITAQDILQSEFIITGASTTLPARNSLQGEPIKIISTNLITSGNWYLLADPNINPVIELGFLDGQQEPILLEEPSNAGVSFSRLIRRFAAMMVFGGTPLDFRGIVGANFAAT